MSQFAPVGTLFKASSYMRLIPRQLQTIKKASPYRES